MPIKQRPDHKDRFRFAQQKASAKIRGIDWVLTYEEWIKIWQDSGHYHERGRKKGQYCMSRYGDTGPYSVDNVFIQKFEDNYAAVGYASKGKKHSPDHIKKWRESFKKTAAKKTASDPNWHAWNKGLKRKYREDGSCYYKETNG